MICAEMKTSPLSRRMHAPGLQNTVLDQDIVLEGSPASRQEVRHGCRVIRLTVRSENGSSSVFKQVCNLPMEKSERR